jgi:hypothetical protein
LQTPTGSSSKNSTSYRLPPRTPWEGGRRRRSEASPQVLGRKEAMRVRRPRWDFNTERDKRNGDGRRELGCC